jgi:S1-C subfamily serine protease
LELLSGGVGLDTDVRLIGHHNEPWGLSRGYISQRPQGTVLQLAGATIGRRSSGGPVLDSENRVVGIVTSIEPPNIGQGGDFLSGFSYGHPSSSIVQMLTAWGIY